MRIRKSLFSLIALSGWISCVDSDSSIGDNLVSSRFTNVYTDTCTVRMSTVRLDSVPTSGTQVALVGQYNDPWFGTLSASSFIAYHANSITINEDAAYVFDSMTLTLDHSGAYWGDTLTRLKFSVHELSRPIELDENDQCYNVTHTSYHASPLLRAEVHYNTGEHRKVELRLPDEMGERWFRKLLDREDDSFQEVESFQNYFNGIALIPDPANNLITSFGVTDSSLLINLYYHTQTNTTTESRLLFSPSTTLHYNRCVHRKEATPLALLDSCKEVTSAQTDQKAYLSGLPGFYTKIEFPYLNNLLETGEKVVITSASLLLYPEPGSYGDKTPLTSELSLFVADENNITQSEVTDLYGVEVQTGNLTLDDYYGRDTYYSFDMTNFLTDQIGKFGKYKQHLQLILSSDTISKCYNTVILRDHPQADLSTRLAVQYQIYNPY